MRVWNTEKGFIMGRDLQGNAVKITQESAIDLYVCGFVCTPFTPNGKRKEWADEHAKTFWSAVKTIASLRPRVAILENVKAISNNSNNQVVTKALSQLKGYVICYLKLNSYEFGVPQHRPRVYMVAFQRAEMNPIFQDKTQSLLEEFFKRKINKCKLPVDADMNFREFLKHMKYPIMPSMQSEESKKSIEVQESEHGGCQCHNVKVVCPHHPCKCHDCSKEIKMKCLWRGRHAKHFKSPRFSHLRRSFLLKWRQVKKDNKLKTPPSYLELARMRGLAIDEIKQPCRRNLLHVLSMANNLMAAKAVLNLCKSMGRHQFRCDGLVPSLGHGCTGVFIPSAAKYMNVPQLMCLSGFHPDANRLHFSQLENHRTSDMDLMIGNTMCLPLVGIVMSAAMSMLV